MPSSRTSRGTAPRKLSDLARKVVIPEGVVGSEWPSVRATCRDRLGVPFDDWQESAGKLILAKRANGKLAAMIDGVGMSLPRQVGKTYLIGAMAFGLALNRPGLLVIWSAHHARTHGETFLSMQSFADRSKVKPYVRQVFTGSGDEEIRFRNGSRILFGARERGFGRGIPGVDMIVSDEAQIMSDKALDAQLATMNVSSFGLGIFVGTPPRPDDPSEAFTRMRSDAWAGRLRDGAWLEFGADPDDDPHDRKVWARANPSFPIRTPVESMLRLQRKLKPDSWLREGLGIWESDAPTAIVPAAQWAALSDAGATRGTSPVFGLDVAEDRAGYVAVAWRRPDGAAHVMLANDGMAVPGHAVVDECARMSREWGGKVFVPPAFEADVVRAGARVAKVSGAEFAAGCGAFVDLVTAGSMRHGNQGSLNTAVKAARWRPAGTQGERAFQLRGAPDVGPLAAVVRALHGLALAADYDVLESAW